MSDHYEILGVSRTAPDDVIRAAYKTRIRHAHPDAGGDQDDAQRVNDAWSVLSDPIRRAAYDQETTQQTPPTASTMQPQPQPQPQHRTARTATPEPTMAEPAPAIARWWRRRPATVGLALWVTCAAALAMLATGMASDWSQLPVSVGVGAVSVVSAAIALHRIATSRAVSALVALAVTAGSGLVVDGMITMTSSLAVATVIMGILIRHSVIAELDDLVLARCDQFWTTHANRPDTEAWFAEHTAPDGNRTTVLLQHLDSDARVTRTLWGTIPQGTYLLLDDGDEPVLSIPHAVMERAGSAAKRKRR